jgi:hypothetical protein
MVASVCDVHSSARSRSRRISRDVGKRASRSLSRAVATRSKSRPRPLELDGGDAFSRRYTTEETPSRRGRSCRPDRHRFEVSEPSLFSHKESHGSTKVPSKNRAVPPPPPRKPVEDRSSSDASPKMNSSLVSNDSNHTESTHPSTAFSSSGHDLNLAIVPYGSKQDKTLPLPPSPKPRRPSRRGSSRADLDRLHRSHRGRQSKFDEETSLLDLSTRSESMMFRRDIRSLGRSKSRSRRSTPRNESSFNDSSTFAEDLSVAKSRTSRRSSDMNRINLREAQRSLSRSARRKSTETECKSARSHSKGGQRSSASIAHGSRRSSMASAKSKSVREISHHDGSSQSVARCYRQVDSPHGTNSSTYELKDSASFTSDREETRSHRRSKSSMSGSRKKSPPAPPPRRSRSRSRPRSRSNVEKDEGQHENMMEGPDLLSNPLSSSSEEVPVLNLVIDDTTGCGSFTVPTLYSSITGSVEKHLQLFTVQLNEPSREFFIQTSMGHLHKIREIHPNTNILRTLSYWNGLQKRRFHDGESNPRRGGQLGISKADSHNKHEVIMTLVGKYHNRDWEYDDDFHTELEKFVEDALRFHACLNGLDKNEVQDAQKKKKGMRLGSIGGSVTGGSHLSGSRFVNASANSHSHEDWMGKKVLCKVLEKITG